MVFENFFAAQSMLLWSAFLIALLLGAVVNKTNFCTMGAVSDMVNIGDWGRMRAWLLAIAVALLGVTLLEAGGVLTLSQTFPPYRGAQLNWIEHLIGGLIFGIGMTFASGCGNKTLIRIGGGNLKSVMVLAVIAVIAYFMTNPFPGSDATLYSTLFYGWTNPLGVNMGTGQDLGSLFGAEQAATARLVIGLLLAALIALFAFKAADFRGSFDNILAGVVVGLAVVALWYVSANVVVEVPDEGSYSLTQYYGEWEMLAESEEGKPAAGAPLAAQSFTFINPMGQTFGYALGGFNVGLLTVGIMTLLGVIAGSFLWSILSRGFRIEWFSSVGDFVAHFIGAILMGLGGVLAMGCTIGQGITGISTLAIGSFITFISIVYGSALTMKVQYYKMVYEEEATFVKALLSGMVDLHLLPSAFRRLDAI
ncbi:MAG: YeeE/YedE family protein [Gammaproteobacteria bacterium]|nr:YeeE/YedE family protein [Gammaproteobacteria bacterium]